MGELESAEAWWQWQHVLKEAQSHCRMAGLRFANPYHNIEHCESVAKVAVFYGMETGLERNDLVALGLAGLFHDVDHSGKPLDVVPDAENINKALKDFHVYASNNFLDEGLSRTVSRIIANTEVQKIDGQIRFQEPTGKLETFIRDADVTQLLFSGGREMQAGLAQEMSLPFNPAFRRKAVDFLYSVSLYTKPARARRASMRDFMDSWCIGKSGDRLAACGNAGDSCHDRP